MAGISSDVKLEKALDMMIKEVENIDDIGKCPIYRWLNDFRMEVAEENIANLKTEIPVPTLDEGSCQECPVKDNLKVYLLYPHSY